MFHDPHNLLKTNILFIQHYRLSLPIRDEENRKIAHEDHLQL